jgi:hypothetical protein
MLYNEVQMRIRIKYLRYLMPYHERDMEIKLQFLKASGIIKRHFGKQMLSETKIHNINLETRQWWALGIGKND